MAARKSIRVARSRKGPKRAALHPANSAPFGKHRRFPFRWRKFDGKRFELVKGPLTKEQAVRYRAHYVREYEFIRVVKRKVAGKIERFIYGRV